MKHYDISWARRLFERRSARDWQPVMDGPNLAPFTQAHQTKVAIIGLGTIPVGPSTPPRFEYVGETNREVASAWQHWVNRYKHRIWQLSVMEFDRAGEDWPIYWLNTNSAYTFGNALLRAIRHQFCIARAGSLHRLAPNAINSGGDISRVNFTRRVGQLHVRQTWAYRFWLLDHVHCGREIQSGILRD